MTEYIGSHESITGIFVGVFLLLIIRGELIDQLNYIYMRIVKIVYA